MNYRSQLQYETKEEKILGKRFINVLLIFINEKKN